MTNQLELYKKMAADMQSGWFVLNMDDKSLDLSDYMAYLLGFHSTTVMLGDFYVLIRDDYKEKVKSLAEAAFLVSNNFYEDTIPVMTGDHGLLWLRIKQTSNDHHAGKNGGDIIYGTIHIMDKSNAPLFTAVQPNKPIDRLFSISDSLFNFLNNDSNENTINAILEDVRKTLNGDRVYIMEMSDFNRRHHCSYEVVSRDTPCKKQTHDDLDTKEVPWYTANIVANKALVYDSLNQIPPQGINEYRMLKSQGIKSTLCIPLKNRESVWGYMGIDLIKNSRKWANKDVQWLMAICNIISIFMELTNTKNESVRKEKFTEDLIRHMPIGYAHTSVIRNDEGEIVDYMMIDYNEKLETNILNNIVVTAKGHLGSEHPDKPLFAKRIGYFKNILSSDTPVEKELFFPQSGIYTHEISYSPAEDQVVDLYVDRTDFQKNEIQIADFENFFSLISEYAKIGYGKFNILTKKGYANKQWMINLGEDENATLDKVVGIYPKIETHDKERIFNFYEDAKNGLHKHFSEEMRVIVNDRTNEYKWIRMNILVTKYEPADNEIEFTGVNYDITESKKVEQELIVSRNKAQTMNRLKSAFLANMSHEIRTPLNAIIGFSELLAEADSKEDKETYLKILKENSDLLLQLISDILDLSKIEAGTFDFTFSNVDINVLCRDVVHSAVIKGTNGVEVVFDETDNDCHIVSDRNRLQQVVSNFVSNALKFTRTGSVHIGYVQADDELKVYCRDTGIGISKEQQEHIFERFVKLNSFAKGTGLGLTICQTIIKQLHGRIGVDSCPGHGSTFWFILPFIFNDDNAPTPRDDTRDIKSQAYGHNNLDKPLILVAEDDESSYMLLSVLLGKSYRMEWARDGNEALEMYRALKPDVILMDIRMPELNGIEATKIIREKDHATPILAVSAYAYEKEKESVISAGCNAFITKPVSEMALKEHINRALMGKLKT